jgi:hypothetical protein
VDGVVLHLRRHPQVVPVDGVVRPRLLVQREALRADGAALPRLPAVITAAGVRRRAVHQRHRNRATDA